jgi:serine/threonine protein kinase HipA of HipAB toxin-antitoxin module
MSEWIDYHQERADAAEAEASLLHEALLHMRGYIKLWSDDVAAGLKPTSASLSEALFLAEMALGVKKK